eukprot:2219207-Heterocapsa_arctica.AAC.1
MEYSTAVAATGHTCAVAIAALENETVFVRDPRAFLVSISRNKQFMILTGDVNDLATNGSPQIKAVIGTLRDLQLIIPTTRDAPVGVSPTFTSQNEPDLFQEGVAWELVRQKLDVLKNLRFTEEEWAENAG